MYKYSLMIYNPHMSQTNEGRKRPRKAKKFRFQIVHKFIVENFAPCKVADIAGGHGLLSYLLNQSGFESMVIDPIELELPWKYTDLEKKVHKIPGEEVDHIYKKFTKDLAKDFDLLLALHGHGVNMEIINAAKEYGKSFLIIPCCVIDEPVEKKEGVHWTDSLFEYAQSLGLNAQKVKLGFMGKDMGIVYHK
jgi:hypothetical protein